MASLKVAAAAAGSAITGVATGLGPRALPAATATVVLLGALACVLDRRLAPAHEAPPQAERNTRQLHEGATRGV
jgi:hypothetical protein